MFSEWVFSSLVYIVLIIGSNSCMKMCEVFQWTLCILCMLFIWSYTGVAVVVDPFKYNLYFCWVGHIHVVVYVQLSMSTGAYLASELTREEWHFDSFFLYRSWNVSVCAASLFRSQFGCKSNCATCTYFVFVCVNTSSYLLHLCLNYRFRFWFSILISQCNCTGQWIMRHHCSSQLQTTCLKLLRPCVDVVLTCPL